MQQLHAATVPSPPSLSLLLLFLICGDKPGGFSHMKRAFKFVRRAPSDCEALDVCDEVRVAFFGDASHNVDEAIFVVTEVSSD